MTLVCDCDLFGKDMMSCRGVCGGALVVLKWDVSMTSLDFQGTRWLMKGRFP